MDDAKRNIQDAIREGDYENASDLLQRYKAEGGTYDDVTAILDAGIGAYYGDRERVWKAIQKGLTSNSRNYELYVMLGNYYLPENLYLTYLCYENALFYCSDQEDRKLIAGMLYQLKVQYHTFPNRTAVIILSHDLPEYTKLCIESIRMTTLESVREIIVVDYSSGDGSTEWLKGQKDIVLVEAGEGGFSAQCNQGILAASKETDVFLMDQDTVLPENALFWLRMGLYAQEDHGTAGAVSNTGMFEQIVEGIHNVSELLDFGKQTNVPVKYPYECRIFLSSFALLIKRSVLDRIGLMDERFRLSDSAEKDYGLRVLKEGFRNIQCKNGFVIHFGVEYMQRETEAYQIALQDEWEKLNEKWGFRTQYYLGARGDLHPLIDEPMGKPLRILEIGCGCGALMGFLKGRYPNAEMYGIELIPEVAEIASCMGSVLCDNVEKMDFPWDDEWFDYIIMGDVLEHLMDPQDVLERLGRCLKEGGHIIGSMPNVRHYSVMIPLLKQDLFTYRDEGILDRTHVKMYTGTEIQRLIERSGYEMESLWSKKIGEPDEEEGRIIDMLNSFLEISSRETWLTYQYLFKAAKI